jgi:hypothetical protein
MLKQSFKLKLVAAVAAFVGLGMFISSPALADAQPLVWSSAAVVETQQGIPVIRSAAFGEGHWVAIRNTGETVISTDGKTWTLGGFSGTTGDIVFGNGKFVAVEGSKSAVSTDNGATWTQGTEADEDDYFYRVAYGDGHFVKAEDDNCEGKLSWSVDGITWTDVMTPSDGCWWDISYGNGTFVSLGNSKVARSTDGGLTWTEHATQVGLDAIEYGNNKFFAVQNAAHESYTSTDGITWVTAPLTGASSAFWSRIAYGNGKWVMVTTSPGYPQGANQNLAISEDDGVTWVADPLDGYDWSDIEFGGGTFVAVGDFVTGTPPAGRTTSPISYLEAPAATEDSVSLANTGYSVETGLTGLLLIGLGLGVRRFRRKQ